MSRPREPFAEVDGGEYVGWWLERFDLPAETFGGLRFFRRGRSTVWISSARPAAVAAARVDTVGLPFLRIHSRWWKPPSVAVIAFGMDAERNVVDVDPREAGRFLAGEASPIDASDPRRRALEPGFVVVRFGGVPLGCGEWHGRDGELRSRLPKSRRIAGLRL